MNRKTIPESRQWIRVLTLPFRFLLAKWKRRFWIACSLCGRRYGGFECGRDGLPTGGIENPYKFQGICPMEKCQAEAKQQSDAHWLALYPERANRPSLPIP
jgi:hypothetical protein